MSVPNYNPGLPMCGARWPNRGPAGGRWTCVLDEGHDGNHEARGSSMELFAFVPQDDEEITWDGPQAGATGAAS